LTDVNLLVLSHGFQIGCTDTEDGMTERDCAEVEERWRRGHDPPQPTAAELKSSTHNANPTPERQYYKTREHAKDRIRARPNISSDATRDARLIHMEPKW
jgi:hypothetical protein